MKSRNFPKKQNDRRLSVIIRLEEQLKKNTKNTREGIQPLTESDIKRIKRELSILNNRIDMSARSKRTKKKK